MALGQHRGLPTRLLDWSYSPLVALHFATEHPADLDTDGVVWCVNFIETNARLPPRLKRMLQREASDTFTADMLSTFGSVSAFDTLTREPFVVFVEPPAIDDRILHQLALFSLISSPAAALDDWLRDRPELYRRVVVPARLKREIRDKLDQANINERVLFPGLDGLSRWLTRYYTPATKPELEAQVEDTARPRLAPGQPAAAPNRFPSCCIGRGLCSLRDSPGDAGICRSRQVRRRCRQSGSCAYVAVAPGWRPAAG